MAATPAIGRKDELEDRGEEPSPPRGQTYRSIKAYKDKPGR